MNHVGFGMFYIGDCVLFNRITFQVIWETVQKRSKLTSNESFLHVLRILSVKMNHMPFLIRQMEAHTVSSK